MRQDAAVNLKETVSSLVFLCPLSIVLCPLSFVHCPLSIVLCPLWNLTADTSRFIFIGNLPLYRIDLRWWIFSMKQWCRRWTRCWWRSRQQSCYLWRKWRQNMRCWWRGRQSYYLWHRFRRNMKCWWRSRQPSYYLWHIFRRNMRWWRSRQQSYYLWRRFHRNMRCWWRSRQQRYWFLLMAARVGAQSEIVILEISVIKGNGKHQYYKNIFKPLITRL